MEGAGIVLSDSGPGTPVAFPPGMGQEPIPGDPEVRIRVDEIVSWAERLHVAPEELRSAVQKGGETVKDVVEELRRRGFER